MTYYQGIDFLIFVKDSPSPHFLYICFFPLLFVMAAFRIFHQYKNQWSQEGIRTYDPWIVGVGLTVMGFIAGPQKRDLPLVEINE